MGTADDIHSTDRISLREALERVGFEVMKPYLHTGRILARHRGLYTSPEGTVRAAPVTPRRRGGLTSIKTVPGGCLLRRWMVEDGRVIQEEGYAYTIDIALDRAAFEMCFPAATGPAEPDGMRAAQESTLEQNAETASSASAASPPAAPQTEPVPPAAEPMIAGSSARGKRGTTIPAGAAAAEA